MAKASAPPPVLCFARVLAYALVDESVQFSGRRVPYVGAPDHELEPLGRVPRLALCQNLAPSEDEIMLFYCDDEWNVLAAAGGNTDLTAAKADAEVAYPGISAKWVDTNVSPVEARRWLEEHYPEDMCSFCGRLPFEFEASFGGHKSRICAKCVRKYFAMLQEDEPEDVA